jgi:hypothetical protein
VQVSLDGQSWGEPIAKGQGTGISTVITFAPVRARYVRITETAAAESPAPWSIQGMKLFQAPE